MYSRYECRIRQGVEVVDIRGDRDARVPGIPVARLPGPPNPSRPRRSGAPRSRPYLSPMLTTALLLALAAPALPQEPADSTPKPQPLFESREVLALTLATDLRTTVRDIGRHVGDNEFEGEEQHPARLSYVSPSGETVDLDIQVKTRGHFRRQKRTCNFPPLRLNIKTGQAKGTLFENQDKLKLVTHCQDGRDDYEQNVLLEYLLYRSYEALDTLSYRVRLTRITYVDTTGRRDTLTKYGFLIENDGMLAQRFGQDSLFEMAGLIGLDLEASTMTKVAVFQFMALNTDWAVSGPHNIKMLGPVLGRVYPIPYDMDWSGLVNARYAKPDKTLGIRSVRDRLYRGYCRPESDFDRALAQFNSQRATVYDLFRNQEGLDPKRLERALEDLDDFYEIINDQRKFEREIMNRCRKR